ncbi:ceramide-1-phosphate transfer protein-like isoform X2 [Arapaima gigas]
MGIKGRAALAVAVLLLVFSSMWLYGSLEHHLEPCLNSYMEAGNVSNHGVVGANEEDTDGFTVKECPGQEFQVSRLLSHLQAAVAHDSDILILPYLSSWDELIKFLNALGPMVGLISQEIKGKTGIIRELAHQDVKRWGVQEPETTREVGGEYWHLEVDQKEDKRKVPFQRGSKESSTVSTRDSESYWSLRSMIEAELRLGLVNFQQQTDSGCRTLLRLHRALLWLQLFLEKLGEKPQSGGRVQSPSELCREAYRETLAQHHTWLIRQAAEMAFVAMPDRNYFFRLVCAQDQKGATLVLNKVVRAIEEVYTRTEGALEEHGMLNLP